MIVDGERTLRIAIAQEFPEFTPDGGEVEAAESSVLVIARPFVDQVRSGSVRRMVNPKAKS